MALIPTKLHAAGDYASGSSLLAAPRLLPFAERRATLILQGTGAAILATSSLTDYELGIVRRIPLPVHLVIDAVTGGSLLAGALALRRAGAKAGSWVPVALVGLGEVAGAALTQRQPSSLDLGLGSDGQSGPQSSNGSTSAMPQAATGLTGEGVAAREPAAGLGVPVAPAPLETPGPSVTPPEQPESDVERAERIDAGLPDPDIQTGDTLVAQQEAAAAAEAAAIGGVVPPDAEDPAMEPVYQAGGGEQEGFEQAEEDLIENATHGDGHGNPERDALSPEAEADESTAVYGEADRIPSTEVVEGSKAGEDDPGAGPAGRRPA